MAQTSDRVSSIAAKILSLDPPSGLTPAQLMGSDGPKADPDGLWVSKEYADEILRDAKILAGSALRQDERPGWFKRTFNRG